MSDADPITPAPVAGVKPPVAAGNPPGSAPIAPRITIEQFCTALSATDKQVELIGSFHNAERAAGHHADSHENYQARYLAFASQPA